MNSRFLLACLGASLTLGGLGLGQGADLCANAQPIAGLGLFNFDNTTATIDGVPDPLCNFFGQQDVDHDVWFSWIAPSNGIFTVETCALTSVDTKIGIYDGSCAGAVLACNDDACSSLQTSLTFSGTAGNIYLIRLGTFPGASGGTGQFQVRDATTLNPANGHSYLVVQNTLSWIAADMAAQNFSLNGSPGHLVTIADQAEQDWLVANLVFDRPWIGLFQDPNDAGYMEPAGGWVWVTGEPVNYLNWAGNEPSNNSASGGAEDYCEMFATGVWNDAELNHLQTIEYIVEFGGALPGDPYCDGSAANCPCFSVGAVDQGCPNSASANGGRLVGSGSASVTIDSFALAASDCPPSKPGLVLSGTVDLSPGVNTVPDSAGLLCVGGMTQRGAVVFTDASGDASLPDFQGAPYGMASNVTAGSASYYQYWFRDPNTACPPNDTAAGDFNFTNGWSVVWQL